MYSNFIKTVIEQNKSIFQKTLPLNHRKREDLLSNNNFTFEKVVNHIEQAKFISAQGSEHRFNRIVDSDQSG